MPTSRRMRRRREEDGEDTEFIAHRNVDDSQSENSLPSDDDGDADDSDLSEVERQESLTGGDETAKTANGAVQTNDGQADAVAAADPAVVDGPDASFALSQDTAAMMNGLKIAEDAPQEEVLDFEAPTGPAIVTSDPRPPSSGGLRRQDNFAEIRRKEHEDYKKKRGADPAFIPTRGSFFMHDQRSQHNGARLLGRGRGRGTVVGGPFSPANMRPPPGDATRTAWAHDLHDTLDAPKPQVGGHQQYQRSYPSNTHGVSHRPAVTAPPGPSIVRNYSTTRELAHVVVRIQMPGMKEAVTYGNTLVRQYTKLPDHRPPLRRDKPVRISLPDKAPRYIFPAVDRSFIFIPRALRPNQQGFGRGRSKLGSMGGFSSRRTSVFGGSVYSPSIAMSRRSSFGRDFRNDMASPAGSVRPVVRLPHGHGSHHSTAVGTPHAMSGHGTPVMNGPPLYYSHGPQKPAYRENWPQNMPMHQPRPQKQVSVAGIEPPASNFQPPPTHDQQPFSHQIPAGVSSHNGQPPQQGYFAQQSYPVQSTGTPLQNIPERAIHAPAFQPTFQQTAYPPQGGYYYPQMPQYQTGAVIAPMVIQNGQQGQYLVPTIAPGPPVPQQGGMQQYEQNGMVFYVDPSQMYMQPPPVPQADAGAQQYAQYAMPGMGGMMTPAPDGSGYYYPVQQGPVYYPQQ